MDRLSRRGVLQAVLSGTALAASGTAVAVERGAAAGIPGLGGAAPWWLVQPLTRGSRLAGGWRVAGLSPVRKGAAVLTLHSPEGEPVEIHLCAHDGRPKGVVHTALVDLIVMDGGRGDKPTDERLGRILLDLARRMRKNEVAVEADALRPLATMLPHGERVDAYGPENL